MPSRDLKPSDFTRHFGDLTPDPHDVEETVMQLSFSASGSPEHVAREVRRQIEAQLADAPEHKAAVGAAIVACVERECRGKIAAYLTGSFYLTVTR